MQKYLEVIDFRRPSTYMHERYPIPNSALPRVGIHNTQLSQHPWTIFRTAYHTEISFATLDPPRHSPDPSPRCLREPRVASAPAPTLHRRLPSPAHRTSASRQPARQRKGASRRETLHSAPSRHEVLISMSRGIQALQPRQKGRTSHSVGEARTRPPSACEACVTLHTLPVLRQCLYPGESTV